jgi:glycosyltransferase involved in cell wall biosynthesis
MKRLLFFTASLHYGGDDAVLIDLARFWPQTDERFVLINRSHPGRSVYEAALGQILTTQEKTIEEEQAASSPWSRPWRALGAILRLRAEVEALRPDCVLVSSGGFPLTALTWRFLVAARLAGPRRLILIVHNYPNPSGAPLRRACRGLFGRLALLLCDQAVAVSGDLAAALEPYNLRSDRPVAVVHNGCEPRPTGRSASEKRAALGVPQGPLIGAIGNIEHRKGFDCLLSAMKGVLLHFPDAVLVLIGAPAQPGVREALLDQARELGIEKNLLLAGFLPEAGQYAECFDICVIPSRAHESFGLLALDAMQYAKPVVATRVGGLPEVVLHEETGLLVAPDDAAALEAALLDLLRSPEKRRRLGQRGRQVLSERFSARRMARSYRDMIECSNFEHSEPPAYVRP